MFQIRSVLYSVLVLVLTGSGCNVTKVLPGSVCNELNTTIDDSILGTWTFDVGSSTGPVEISRPMPGMAYRIVSIPTPDASLALDIGFRICRATKSSMLVEVEKEEPGDTYVHVLRLSRVGVHDVSWIFERVDARRADFSGLTVNSFDPPGLIKLEVDISTGGPALLDFLAAAPFQFTALLRR